MQHVNYETPYTKPLGWTIDGCHPQTIDGGPMRPPLLRLTLEPPLGSDATDANNPVRKGILAAQNIHTAITIKGTDKLGITRTVNYNPKLFKTKTYPIGEHVRERLTIRHHVWHVRKPLRDHDFKYGITGQLGFLYPTLHSHHKIKRARYGWTADTTFRIKSTTDLITCLIIVTSVPRQNPEAPKGNSENWHYSSPCRFISALTGIVTTVPTINQQPYRIDATPYPLRIQYNENGKLHFMTGKWKIVSRLETKSLEVRYSQLNAYMTEIKRICDYKRYMVQISITCKNYLNIMTRRINKIESSMRHIAEIPLYSQNTRRVLLNRVGTLVKT